MAINCCLFYYSISISNSLNTDVYIRYAIMQIIFIQVKLLVKNTINARHISSNNYIIILIDVKYIWHSKHKFINILIWKPWRDEK